MEFQGDVWGCYYNILIKYIYKKTFCFLKYNTNKHTQNTYKYSIIKLCNI